MVIVQSGYAAGKVIVIFHLSVFQIEFTYTVFAVMQVEIALFSLELRHVCHDLKCISRHMNRDGCAGYIKIVNTYFPEVLAFCRILRNSVAQSHIDMRIGQRHIIDTHSLLF